MTEDELFNQSFWMNLATGALEISSDLEGLEHLVERFVGQYLPVLLKVSNKDDFDHAWLAYWNYLVAPRTNRKPGSLSSRAADNLIAEFQSVFSQREPES